MSYSSLVAAKTAAGSIASWTGYAPLVGQSDIILTEAQSLIYQQLRTREMRSQWVFGLPVGSSKAALPARFLDPIGRLVDQANQRYRHKTESTVTEARNFDPTISGSFGNNPFTTGAQGSAIVTAVQPNHGLNQSADITIAGSGTTDGVLTDGTSLVTAVIDANTFQFEVIDDSATVGGITGGGAAATYTANNLISGTPAQWAIWDEFLQFDMAFNTATQFRLMCFKSKPFLSTINQTNFLTDRYPLLLRKATQCAAADWMRDDNEYTKTMTSLTALIQATNAESDFMYRGADLDMETP